VPRLVSHTLTLKKRVLWELTWLAQSSLVKCFWGQLQVLRTLFEQKWCWKLMGSIHSRKTPRPWGCYAFHSLQSISRKLCNRNCVVLLCGTTERMCLEFCGILGRIVSTRNNGFAHNLFGSFVRTAFLASYFIFLCIMLSLTNGA